MHREARTVENVWVKVIPVRVVFVGHYIMFKELFVSLLLCTIRDRHLGAMAL